MLLKQRTSVFKMESARDYLQASSPSYLLSPYHLLSIPIPLTQQSLPQINQNTTKCRPTTMTTPTSPTTATTTTTVLLAHHEEDLGRLERGLAIPRAQASAAPSKNPSAAPLVGETTLRTEKYAVPASAACPPTQPATKRGLQAAW